MDLCVPIVEALILGEYNRDHFGIIHQASLIDIDLLQDWCSHPSETGLLTLNLTMFLKLPSRFSKYLSDPGFHT